jgi:hypothetical protein
MKPVVDWFNTFIHISVPITSTQPEKALIFMQWLMTDKEVADILTFGSQLMTIKHYRFAEDGTIIPEKRNTIYGFCNLVANFSDNAFLYGCNDVIHQYKERTYQAIYPYFYQLIDSDNERYKKLRDIFKSEPIRTQSDKRASYLRNSIDEILRNSYGGLNTERIKDGLSEILDAKEYKERIIDALNSL